jgi:hypothetical protein
MDPIRFDRMVQSLALSPRRRFLQAIAGTTVAFLTHSSKHETLARKGKKKKRKPLNSRAKRKGLNQTCDGSKSECEPGLECCKGFCKKRPGALCEPEFGTGRDSTCCTGFCEIPGRCCAGPGKDCAGAGLPNGGCCNDGINFDLKCEAGTCVERCPERALRAEDPDDECCANPITVRGEQCCPRGSGNSYFCGRFKCTAFLTGTGPGGCDLWCVVGAEGALCGPGVPGIPTGENNGRACCCTQAGTGTCVWP